MDTYDGMVWGASNNALPGAADDSFQRVSSTIDNPVEGERGRGDGDHRRGLRRRLAAHDRRAAGRGLPAGGPDGEGGVLPLQPGHLHGGRAVGDPPRRQLLLHRRPADDESREETLASTALAPRRRAPASSRRPPPTGRRRPPRRRWSACWRSPSTSGPRASTPTGSPRPSRSTTPATTLQRLSDEFVNDQQMVGNDEQYAAVMALLANEVGVPARVVLGAVGPRGRGRHRQGRAGLGRAAGRGRLVADPAHRAVHVRRATGRAAARDQHPDERHRRAAARADPAAVGRRRPERRRPQGTQGHKKATRTRTSVIAGASPPGWASVGQVRRRAAAVLAAILAVDRRRQGAPAPPAPQRRQSCRPASSGPGASSSTMPATWGSRCRSADRHPARAVGLDRFGVGADAGPPGRQLRLRSDRARGGRRGDLLGIGRVGAQGDVAVGGPPPAVARGDQRRVAAAWQDDVVGGQSAGANPCRAPSAPTIAQSRLPSRPRCLGCRGGPAVASGARPDWSFGPATD